MTNGWIPYFHVDGVPTFKDSQIMELWHRMEREGTAKRVFYGGTVLSAQDFLAYMKDPENHLWVFVEDGKPVAFFWLNNFEGRTARIHFCAFKAVWGDQARKIGADALKLCLEDRDGEGPLLDCLIGYTPAKNRLVRRFIREIGMETVGEVPALLFDAQEEQGVKGLIVSCTRENFA